MDKSDVIKYLHSLEPTEYASILKEVHKDYPYRTTALTNEIVNRWRKDDKVKVSGGSTRSSSSGPESKPDRVSLGGSAVVSTSGSSKPGGLKEIQDRHMESCTSSGPASKHDREKILPWQKSAWKSGLIFRGDKVPVNGKLFLDVEKVTLRKDKDGNHHQKAATIAIVNEDGKVVLWAFIRRNHEDVCQYSPKITNLNERKLGIGVDLAMIHKCLDICLNGNLVVGFALNDDFKSLDYPYANQFDLQSVFRDNNPFSLGLIAQKLMQSRSGFQAGHHAAIDDARMTAAIYKKYQQLNQIPGEIAKVNKRLSAARSDYKKSKPVLKSEKCSCK